MVVPLLKRWAANHIRMLGGKGGDDDAKVLTALDFILI
jgi:hypothetical protein